MNGVTFRYYAVANYRTLIADYGFALEHVYDDPGVSTYYFARKTDRVVPFVISGFSRTRVRP
jgi:hypothetical protein